ncbi:MAG: conjugal transfer protein TraG, partial [Chryseobacterium sp.]
AYRNKAMAQLEGQIASAKIGLARLSSPQLYYVLNGNDFTLVINNPQEPKIVCVGNNPQKVQTYGAVLSLYVSKMMKLVNRKNQLKCSLIFDEFPTIYVGGSSGIDGLLATARGNKVATTLAVQDFSQLKKDYGAEQADVITGIVGNIISGQVTGDTAKKLSETFGKIVQDRESRSINSSDISISKSTQMDSAIPASKIASLSSGEFVGIVADTPDQKIKLKMFHAEIQNDHQAIAEEEKGYKPIPIIQKVTYGDIIENYMRIKEDIDQLFETELEKILARQSKEEDSETEKAEPSESTEGEEDAEKGVSL